MLVFLLFILNVFGAAEYDTCKNPQIITGTTNIYLEDLEDRQIIQNKKGIFVQFQTQDQSEGYHLYTLSDVEVALIEVDQCDHANAYYGLPWDLSFSAKQNRTFWLAVPATTTEPIVIVVERMLYSEDEKNPVIIREEFFPLELKVHGDLKNGKVYYRIVGRTNWKVDLYIDDDYSTTYDVRQGEEELVTIPITDAGIHKVKFDYAKANAEAQEISIDAYQPSVLNAVFRPNALFEENDCFEDPRIIVRYAGKATGKLVITDKASGITHLKYLKTAGKCIQIEQGVAYDVNGEYEIILTTNMFVTGDSYVIFTVGYADGSEPTPDDEDNDNEEQSGSGFTDEAIIAMAVVTGIVGILMIIAMVLLIFIIYKKCTKKGGEYQQLN